MNIHNFSIYIRVYSGTWIIHKSREKEKQFELSKTSSRSGRNAKKEIIRKTISVNFLFEVCTADFAAQKFRDVKKKKTDSFPLQSTDRAI